jgi:hypothetical protein
MALRNGTWARTLLNFGAGAFLCAALGCKTTGSDGPNLNAPKTVGSGNQVLNSPTSQAFKNVNGTTLPNGQATGPKNNASALVPHGNPNPAMQGVQLPATNPVPNTQVNPGQQNPPLVLPTQFGPQGQADLMLPDSIHLPPQPQHPGTPGSLQIPPTSQQQPPQGAMLLPNNQGMLDLQIPQAPPANAREAVNAGGANLMPVSYNQPNPTPEPASGMEKKPSVRVLAEYTSPRQAGEAAKVVTTPVEHQPVLEPPITQAPITPLR